jgi:hypothetical protein
MHLGAEPTPKSLGTRDSRTGAPGAAGMRPVARAHAVRAGRRQAAASPCQRWAAVAAKRVRLQPEPTASRMLSQPSP